MLSRLGRLTAILKVRPAGVQARSQRIIYRNGLLQGAIKDIRNEKLLPLCNVRSNCLQALSWELIYERCQLAQQSAAPSHLRQHHDQLTEWVSAKQHFHLALGRLTLALYIALYYMCSSISYRDLLLLYYSVSCRPQLNVPTECSGCWVRARYGHSCDTNTHPIQTQQFQVDGSKNGQTKRPNGQRRQLVYKRDYQHPIQDQTKKITFSISFSLAQSTIE